MEPLAFADVIPVALLIVGALITLGVYGSKWFSTALFAGLLARMLMLALRLLGYSPFQRDEDARTFAEGSLRLLESGVGIYPNGGAGRYQSFLYLLRRYGDLSVFGLEALAVVGWLVGGLLLLNSLQMLLPTTTSRAPMWIVALSPSGLLWTNGILREGYEFAIIALAVWSYAKVRAVAPQSLFGRGPVIAAASAAMLGGLIHTALTLSAVGLVVGSEMIRGLQQETRRRGQVVLYAAVIVVLMFFGQALAGPTATLQEERTQRSEFGGSAGYRAGLPNLGPASVPADIVLGYALYVVSPLPYQIRGPFDLIALSESWVRVAIMALAFRRKRSIDMNIMLLLAAMVQLSFSVGTLNWGTALRHNYVSLPPLVVLACAYTAGAKERSHRSIRSDMSTVRST